jgi:hypothetical protein
MWQSAVVEAPVVRWIFNTDQRGLAGRAAISPVPFNGKNVAHI